MASISPRDPKFVPFSSITKKTWYLSIHLLPKFTLITKEKHTDTLSRLYETPTAKIETYQDFIKHKEQVTNYTRVTNGV